MRTQSSLRTMRTRLTRQIARRVPPKTAFNQPRRRKSLPLWSAISGILLAGISGATLAYFLDRKQGRRRRHTARDQLISIIHRSAAHADRLSRLASSYLYGLAQKMIHLRHAAEPAPNDETLTQRVRSQILRSPEFHKHRIMINAEHGLVVLRGEVDNPKQMRALEKKARKVPGVRDVENLLHLPGCPAPTHL